MEGSSTCVGVWLSCRPMFNGMKIGFDGKRAFQNNTGLGNYSRSLLIALAEQFPQHQYHLFAPKITSLFDTAAYPYIHTVLPTATFDRYFPAVWRRRSMVKDISANEIDLFHGLSNELPAGIEKSGAKSVITVHDLVFERYPQTYPLDQRFTHRWKMKHSCHVADAVIAASQQTKQDLVDFYKIPGEKIFVCYQHCSPAFETILGEAKKKKVQEKYQLPDRFFLFVSSITERKNLVTVCKALALLKDTIEIPLVVIGNGKREKQRVKKFLEEEQLTSRVIFLNELPAANEKGFTSSADFPAIYQQALALLYPSVFEGFGIPLLEAMWSGLPVISSDTSSLPEVSGEAALYFSPHDVETLAAHMVRISKDTELVSDLKVDGLKRAKLFTAQQHAKTVMDVYQKLIKG